jgi:putative ABC transport system permease protein
MIPDCINTVHPVPEIEHITIGPVVFLEAGIITVGVALATIAWQSVKAARVNPVQSLRNE